MTDVKMPGSQSPATTHGAVEHEWRLSPGQQRIFVLDEMSRGSGTYTVVVSYEVTGALDVDALQSAWASVCAKNPALRLRFGMGVDEPWQGIHPLSDDSFVVVRDKDVTELAGRTADRARHGISLSAGVPARLVVGLARERACVLSLAMHHIICDDGSLEAVLRDLGAGYAAAREGRAEADAEEPDLSFIEWAEAQTLAQQRMQSALDYWAAHLEGLAPLDLPSDLPRPAVATFAGASEMSEFPSDLSIRIRDFAKEERVTPYSVLLTAFEALLARLADQSDFAVGSAMNARPRHHNGVGFYLGTLIHRAYSAGSPSFCDAVRRTQSATAAALEHASVPLTELVQRVEPDRSGSRPPLFQVMFDMFDPEPPELRLAELETKALPGEIHTAKFDLTLQVSDPGSGPILAALEYSTDLFRESTAKAILESYVSLLVAALEAPDSVVSRLLPSTGPEVRALQFGATPEHPDGGDGTLDRVLRAAESYPQADALVVEDIVWSYARLKSRIMSVAHALSSEGVGRGDVVAVCLPRSPEMVATFLASWACGAAYVPIDPENPQDRVHFVLEDSGASAVVTSSAVMSGLTIADDQNVVLIDDVSEVAGNAVAPTRPDAGDLAYIIYTSGTTGRPKGVMITHAGLSNYLRWAADTYLRDSQFGAALMASPAFDLVVPNIYVPLAHGRSVHIFPGELDVATLTDRLVESGPFAFLKVTPAHLQLLLEQLSPSDLGGLAEVLVGAGDAFTDRLAAALHAATSASLFSEYGPTEITVGNSIERVQSDLTTALVPLGEPIPGTSMYLLDQNLQPCLAGAIGEVYVGGVGVAQGYARGPGLTASRFLPDPFAGVPGVRMYRTGDLARLLPTGGLDFAGRVDDQVKVNGYRIELAEIEAAVGGALGVDEAVCAVDQGQLVCYLTSAAPQDLSHSEIGKHVSKILPQHMRPARFVPVGRIPLTSNGKVDRPALTRTTAPALGVGGASTKPRTELEGKIADVMESVLRLNSLGVDDGFFDVGGDSIRAVGVVGRLRDLGYDVEVRDIFSERTVGRLAALVAQRNSHASLPTLAQPFELVQPDDAAHLPEGLDDAYPLSHVQAGMVFEMFSDPALPYHNGTTYRLPDKLPLDVGLLEQAANLVVARHEVLRTSFDLHSYSEPLQLVHHEATFSVGSQDLRGLARADQEARIHEYMRDERRKPFDIGAAPLIRVFAHTTGDTEWWMSITEFHPIIEGWGYHQMIMEIIYAYQALRRGRSPEFEALPPVRFADFVAEERRAVVKKEHAEYWGSVVRRSMPITIPMSWGSGNPGEQEIYDASFSFTDLRPALLDLARQARVSLKTVVHAAHLKVMSLLTTDESFTSGLVCDTRPEVTGAERVFGMYLNTVPFEFRRQGSTWLEMVQAVFETEVEVLGHRRFPAPLIQEKFGCGGRLNHVIFNYLDFNTVDSTLVDTDSGIDYSPNDFDLVVVAHRFGEFRVSAKARTCIPEFAELLASLYRRVLELMASDPQGITSACCLPEAEVDRVVRDGNATRVEWPRATVHGLFEAQVDKAPRETAIITADQARVTFSELNVRANHVAHELRALGARPTASVGVSLAHGVELFASILGILKAGCAYVPLDASHPMDRLQWIVEDTGVSIVVTSSDLVEQLPLAGRETVLVDRDAARLIELPSHNPSIVTDPDDLVYLMFTSGSTGRPKGVMNTHAGLVNYLLWGVAGYGLGGCEGAPMLGSVAFDLSIPNFMLPLIAGKSVTVLPGQETLAGLRDALLSNVDYSLLKITPGHLDVLRAMLGPDTVLRSVRTYVVGADEVKAETVVAWRKLAPHARIIDEYGPTETIVGCSVYVVPPGHPANRPVPIGWPIANMQMYVLDADLNPVPRGAVGELYIGGVGVARGYMNRPGLTASKFLPDPFSSSAGARFYRTGDLARRLADGNFEFLGRADNQVKIRGYRVELGEVEAQLNTHPDVAAVCVAATTDGRGGKRLTGYIVCPGEAPSSKDLRQFLVRSLPEYMIPSGFVVLPELPLSSGGKVDRQRLPLPNTAPRTREGERTGTAPRDEIERRIQAIWLSVIGVADVGVEDDFAEVGGHSLLALQVVGRVRSEIAEHIDIPSLLQARTIADQAEAVRAQSPQRPVLTRLNAVEKGRPVVVVHAAGGGLFAYQDLGAHLDQPLFGVAASSAALTAENLSDVAASYVDVVAGLGPDVVLAGWSVGGVIAYEVAVQLSARFGWSPPVFLCDSHAEPSPDNATASPSDPQALSWVVRDWATVVGSSASLAPATLAAISPEKRLEAAVSVLTERGLAERGSEDAVRAVIEMTLSLVRAAGVHEVTVGYPGHVTLIAAAGEPDGPEGADHGWAAASGADVEVVSVPGDHYEILRGNTLADVLTASLPEPRPPEEGT